MSTQELLSCPFCGSKAEYVDGGGMTGVIGVSCSNCTANMLEEHWHTGKESTEEIQVRLSKEWNRRVYHV